MKTQEKIHGRIFTPEYIVDNMLDLCGYNDTMRIVGKHIMENSCGEGAFLCRIVERYCEYHTKLYHDSDSLKKELETYIHGIEIDKPTYIACLKNLDRIAAKYHLDSVKWDIQNEDALQFSRYDGLMDYVIGNPPYVRVHNLEDSYSDVKRFSFTDKGMTDLFLAFFEIGLRMLKPAGRLCYITPNSWLNSVAGKSMRNYIQKTKILNSLIDLQHFSPFQATTYPLISLLIKGVKQETIHYYRYEPERKEKIFIGNLSYSDFCIDNEFYLATPEKLNILKEIRSTRARFVRVKNGFATLADDVFIGNIPFQNYTIDVLKASTGEWKKAFFPYDENGKPIGWNTLRQHGDIVNYLEKEKTNLLKGASAEEKRDWYLYGRTQALKDVYHEKLAINTVIKNTGSLKLNKVAAGKGIYSGLYILSHINFDTIRNILESNDFMEYIILLKKYKNGGYYTFNSKDLEQYLNYKLEQYYRHEGTRNIIPSDQYGISESSRQRLLPFS